MDYKTQDKYHIKHTLSKSTFVKGKQCRKMLYLSKFKKKESKQFSKQTQVLFTFGKDFEDRFREKFEDSFHLKEIAENNFHLYAGYTKELLKSKKYKAIFEAGFVYNEVLILTDVVQQNFDNSYTIYEIKFSNKIKPVVLWDLSLQYYVLKNSLKNIESFNVVLKGKKNKFRINDITKLVERKLSKTEEEINTLKEVLSLKKEPEVKIGSQCFRPYECQFFEYCRKHKKS